MEKVFISYAHDDVSVAQELERLLQKNDVSVAIDRNIPAGVSWRDWIRENIEGAGVVLVLWSRHSMGRDWVRAEAELAKNSCAMLPLLVDDIQMEDLPFGFGERQGLRLVWDGQGQLSESTATALLESLHQHLGTVTPLKKAIAELRRTLEEKTAGQYEILEQLGSGRMSVVFKARHLELEDLVAIKVTPLAGMFLFPAFLERYLQGIRAAKSLKSPHILNVRDLRLEDTIAFVVMDYIDGEPLSERMARGRLELDEVRATTLQIAEALCVAHGEDVVHRNLNPTAVMLTKCNQVVLMDFGLAQVGPEECEPSSLFAMPGYAAPEQCEGQRTTTRTDQYSLGVLLYEMLGGQTPYQGTPFQVMEGHCRKRPRPITDLRPDCPPDIEATLTRLMSRAPEERFVSSRRMVDDIRAWSGVRFSSAMLPSTPAIDPARARKIAKASFDRCMHADPRFFDKFYERLAAVPELREHVLRLNIDRHTSALQASVDRLLDLADNAAEGLEELTRLKRVHGPLGLEPGHFATFVEVLAELASECDPKVEGDAEPRLAEAWKLALASVTDALAVTQVPPPPGILGEPRTSAVRALGENQRREEETSSG